MNTPIPTSNNCDHCGGKLTPTDCVIIAEKDTIRRYCGLPCAEKWHSQPKIEDAIRPVTGASKYKLIVSLIDKENN